MKSRFPCSCANTIFERNILKSEHGVQSTYNCTNCNEERIVKERKSNIVWATTKYCPIVDDYYMDIVTIKTFKRATQSKLKEIYNTDTGEVVSSYRVRKINLETDVEENFWIFYNQPEDKYELVAC